MRTAVTAFISAASFCVLATAASAQVAPFWGPTPYPYAGSAPTIPSNTGAPLYSYHHTTALPGAVGSCSIIAGNRVCSAMPAGTDNPAPAYGYGYGAGGPVGVIVAAPFNAAGAIASAPFGGPYYGYGYGNPIGAAVAAPVSLRRNDCAGHRYARVQLRKPCRASARRRRALRSYRGQPGLFSLRLAPNAACSATNPIAVAMIGINRYLRPMS
jgi:hypothetical protein